MRTPTLTGIAEATTDLNGPMLGTKLRQYYTRLVNVHAAGNRRLI